MECYNVKNNHRIEISTDDSRSLKLNLLGVPETHYPRDRKHKIR